MAALSRSPPVLDWECLLGSQPRYFMTTAPRTLRQAALPSYDVGKAVVFVAYLTRCCVLSFLFVGVAMEPLKFTPWPRSSGAVERRKWSSWSRGSTSPWTTPSSLTLWPPLRKRLPCRKATAHFLFLSTTCFLTEDEVHCQKHLVQFLCQWRRNKCGFFCGIALSLSRSPRLLQFV